MMDAKIKLDFVVAGAQKSGTTSLHNMLTLQPEVVLPTMKETHFFSHSDRAAHGKKWYLEQFPKNQTADLVGEVDPEYMFAPQAPTKIKAMTTANKFIFILRHPLDRAYSQYQMTRRRGYEPLEFGAAIANEQVRLAGDRPDFALDHWSYVTRSLYSNQIQRFFSVFPNSDFLFLRSDMLSDVGYEKLCNFIGIHPIRRPSETKIRSNSASMPRSTMLRDLLYAPRGKSTFRSILVKVLPDRIKTHLFLWLDKLNQKSVQTNLEAAYAEAPSEVLVAFVDDLSKTETLTGLDLSDWRKDIQMRLENGKHHG